MNISKIRIQLSKTIISVVLAVALFVGVVAGIPFLQPQAATSYPSAPRQYISPELDADRMYKSLDFSESGQIATDENSFLQGDKAYVWGEGNNTIQTEDGAAKIVGNNQNGFAYFLPKTFIDGHLNEELQISYLLKSDSSASFQTTVTLLGGATEEKVVFPQVYQSSAEYGEVKSSVYFASGQGIYSMRYDGRTTEQYNAKNSLTDGLKSVSISEASFEGAVICVEYAQTPADGSDYFVDDFSISRPDFLMALDMETDEQYVTVFQGSANRYTDVQVASAMRYYGEDGALESVTYGNNDQGLQMTSSVSNTKRFFTTLSTQYTNPASVEIGIAYEVQVDFFNPAQAGGNYVRIDPGYFRYPDGGGEIITLNPGTISFDIAPQSTKTFHFRMEFSETDGVQYEKLTYWLTDTDDNFTQGDKTTVNLEAGYNSLPTVSFTPANADQHIVRSHSLDFVVQSEDENGNWADGKEVKVIMDNYVVSESRVDIVSDVVDNTDTGDFILGGNMESESMVGKDRAWQASGSASVSLAAGVMKEGKNSLKVSARTGTQDYAYTQFTPNAVKNLVGEADSSNVFTLDGWMSSNDEMIAEAGLLVVQGDKSEFVSLASVRTSILWAHFASVFAVRREGENTLNIYTSEEKKSIALTGEEIIIRLCFKQQENVALTEFTDYYVDAVKMSAENIIFEEGDYLYSTRVQEEEDPVYDYNKVLAEYNDGKIRVEGSVLALSEGQFVFDAQTSGDEFTSLESKLYDKGLVLHEIYEINTDTEGAYLNDMVRVRVRFSAAAAQNDVAVVYLRGDEIVEVRGTRQANTISFTTDETGTFALVSVREVEPPQPQNNGLEVTVWILSALTVVCAAAGIGITVYAVRKGGKKK